jgi:hypothetical protein
MSTHFVGLSLPAPCLSKPSHINLEYNKDEERCNSPASPTSPLTPPIASNRLFPLSPAHLKTSTSAVTKAHNAMDGQEVFIDDGTLTPTYDLSYYFHLGSSSEDLQSNLHRERAASIGSILSSKPTIIPVQTSNDKALKYKQKTDKSNQKAYQFFGEQVKLEISAKEIKKEGLKALLYSTVPLGYFLYHLLQEYSSENLVCHVFSFFPFSFLL